MVSVRSEDPALERAHQLVNTHARRSGSSQQSLLRPHLLPLQKDDGKLRIEIRRRNGTQGVRLGAG
jgi:hypothetical protein